MSAVKIDAALMTAAKAALESLSPSIPVAWEGAAFVPPDDSRWAAVFQLPSASPPASLGVFGQDEHIGVLQIDLNTPRDQGTGAHRAFADAIAAQFPAGKRFTYEGQCVLVTRCERGRVRPVEAWARMSISINWVAMVTRPEV